MVASNPHSHHFHFLYGKSLFKFTYCKIKWQTTKFVHPTCSCQTIFVTNSSCQQSFVPNAFVSHKRRAQTYCSQNLHVLTTFVPTKFGKCFVSHLVSSCIILYHLVSCCFLQSSRITYVSQVLTVQVACFRVNHLSDE
jgi:hypothetical protein